MKLLQEVLRWCTAGMRGVSMRGTTGPRELRVTVPASLPKAVTGSTATNTTPGIAVVPSTRSRSEPASFLKAPRHLRQLSGR